MLPREGFNDLNQSAQSCLSAKMKTPARLGTGHGKNTMANVCGYFFKKNVVREKH